MIAGAWPPPAPGTRWLHRLPNWVGDAVMVLPALRALPRREQTWIGVAHPRVLPLYAASGLFQVLLGARGGAAPAALVSRVRRLGPDRAVVFTTAPSGALLARISGARDRLGRSGGGGGFLLTHPMAPRTRSRKLWRDYLEIAVEAGGEAPDRPDFRLDPGSESRGAADRLLAPLGGEAPVVVAAGAVYGPAKQWPLERFVDLAARLRARGIPVVALGGAGERDAGARLGKAGAVDLTGKTGLLEAVAVLERARALVANDSGAIHLGRAAGAPLVAIFGSSSPEWTGPEAWEGETIRLGIPCSPCFRRRCPLRGEEHLRCLRGIGVEDVLERLARLGAVP